jgi:hypothetical protein
MTTVAGIFINAPHDGQIYMAERRDETDSNGTTTFRDGTGRTTGKASSPRR